MRTAALDYQVKVVRGTQILAGRVVDKIIDLNRRTVTLTDFGDPGRLAADAFSAGTLAQRAATDPTFSPDEVSYVNDAGVSLAVAERARERRF